MALFICYSHVDKDFVDKLAHALVDNKARVWVDRWELNVGDSLIQRIQDAISEADGLLVVLSKSSVESEWCKKELNAGLMRELSEKRVLVLPVLIEDCEIPLLLREKLYADFRGDFEQGLIQILEATAKVVSDTLGRIDKGKYLTDFSISWGFRDDLFEMQMFVVSLTRSHPFSVLAIVTIRGNQAATQRFHNLIEIGHYEQMKQFVLGYFAGAGLAFQKGLRFVLEDSNAKEFNMIMHDPKRPEAYEVHIDARRLGEDTGKNILFDFGETLQQIFEISLSRAEKLDNAEMKKVWDAMEKPLTT
jgi:hypothetical protein